MNDGSPIRFLIIVADEAQASETIPRPSLRDLAQVYYLLSDQGADVVVATAAGGFPRRLDETTGLADPFLARFRNDRRARDILADTLSLDQLAVEDFAGAFCIGSCSEVRAIGLTEALIAAFRSQGVPVAVLEPAREQSARAGFLVLTDAAEAPLLSVQALVCMARDRLRSVG